MKCFVSCALLLILGFSAACAEEVPFRPEDGTFPALEKAHSYRGELVFVDHANRRGSLRVQTNGYFFRNPPSPFAMLPYGIIRYHNAPADLRDIPLGTMLHVTAFLPPDPKISSVPVLPIDNKKKGGAYQGEGGEPAENHVLLLEDEPSHCLRVGKVWRLKEARMGRQGGFIIATCEPTTGTNAKEKEEKLHFDAATRIHRGRDTLTLNEWMAEDAWPAEGTKSLGGRSVQLGIVWKPTIAGAGVQEGVPFTSFHIADIWLDDASMQRAADHQTEVHKVHMRSYWLPAWVDSVEYGKVGNATVTVTLFGGMDPSLYAEFKPGVPALINGAENTLKHVAGPYGPAHMASKGSIRDVTKATGDVPLGSSGIQIRFETELIVEGIRPGRIVRVRPAAWPRFQVPREEYLGNGDFNLIDRFPTPAIFPKY